MCVAQILPLHSTFNLLANFHLHFDSVTHNAHVPLCHASPRHFSRCPCPREPHRVCFYHSKSRHIDSFIRGIRDSSDGGAPLAARDTSAKKLLGRASTNSNEEPSRQANKDLV